MGYCLISNTRSDELNLDYLGRTIETPQAKSTYLDVPLSDGELDLSYVLSPVMRYKMRTITVRFELRLPRIQWAEWMREFCGRYHGNTIRLSFGDDPDYYWTGRAKVGALEDHNSTAGISLSVYAEPFKRTTDAVYSENISFTSSQSQELSIDLKNARGYVNIKAVSLASGGAVQVVYNGETFNINADVMNVDLIMAKGSDDTIQLISNTTSNVVKVEIYGGDF